MNKKFNRNCSQTIHVTFELTEFLQAAVISILRHGCTTWTLTKRLEKKLDGNTPQDTNYTATCLLSRKLSKLDEPDMQDTAGEAGTSL